MYRPRARSNEKAIPFAYTYACTVRSMPRAMHHASAVVAAFFRERRVVCGGCKVRRIDSKGTREKLVGQGMSGVLEFF